MESSTEQIYSMLKTYLFPILKFANIYVDDFGILRPIGRDPELSYQEEGRELVIIDSQAKLLDVKAHKEDYQIFNPFSIPKQCVFLANMVMMAANEKDDWNDKNDDMYYDEDLDSYIAKDESSLDKDLTNTGSIKMFESRDKDFPINSKITFAHTDSSGNPVDELASFSHMNIMMATIGAMINLIKCFQKTITKDFVATEIVVMNIEKTLAKIQSTREKEKKVKVEKLEINRIEDDEEMFDDINEVDREGYFIDIYMSVDKLFFPEDKKWQYDPSIAESKINKNLILPGFKTLNDTEDIIQEFSDMSELDQYKDLDFDI